LVARFLDRSMPHKIAGRLVLDLSERQLKSLRKTRRRICSYLGSKTNIYLVPNVNGN